MGNRLPCEIWILGRFVNATELSITVIKDGMAIVGLASIMKFKFQIFVKEVIFIVLQFGYICLMNI